MRTSLFPAAHLRRPISKQQPQSRFGALHMNIKQRTACFLLTVAMAAVVIPSASAEESETAKIKFSNPQQPGTLRVSVSTGDIRIRGEDTAEVTVRTELAAEGNTQRPDGLRVLTSSSSYSLTEKDNVINLSYGSESWPGSGGDFEITVPRSTNIIVSSAFGGEVSIGQVSGDVEVKSLNGEVSLSDISGGALVETMNGEIEAQVTSLNEAKPLSFTSMNGEVALRLPADAKASVRLRTHNGAILTDFDEKQLVTKTAALKASDRRLPGEDSEDIRATVREAVKMGMDAAREAARGAREAMREAQREMGEQGHVNSESEDVIGHPVPPMPPLPPMTGGKIVSGTLNGGGPEIRITTMNGDVTLRKIVTAK
jgi:hypothetical protein